MPANPYLTKIRVDRAKLWKGKAPLISALDMELTERCNLNCIHCYINQPADNGSVKKRELSTEKVKAVLSEAASLGCLMVRFTGGEPLLREDFEEIYLFSRNLGLKVLLFTNATLVTPRLVETFSRIPPLTNIEITVYGLKKKSYESVTRIPGSFNAAFDGIHLLQRNRIPVELKTVILPPNKNELAQFEVLAKSFPGMEGPTNYSMALDLRCRRDSQLKNRSIKRLRMTPAESIKLLGQIDENYLNEMKLFCAGFMAPAGDRLFPCGAGEGSGCVDAYGDLQPCMLLRHPETVYHLAGGSIRDALARFFPEMRKLKASHPEYLKRCAHCFLKGLCEQCPAKSWMEHGTLDTPVEYFCALAHAQAEYLGMLGPGESAWEVQNGEERIKAFSGSTLPEQDGKTDMPCQRRV
jgi:radical SAM protein with 4Fe4S-binding SPASM domain